MPQNQIPPNTRLIDGRDIINANATDAEGRLTAALTQAQADALYKAIGYVPAWGEVTSKPETFPPSTHKATHATGGADAIAPGDIGAKPDSYQPNNYQALLETNLDKLLRGTLYTKASPFSQSFTFSGDGIKTAFKIPRSSVTQQGWVRGGVTATVGGLGASGTYDVHTQTFTFGTAPAAGTDNVVLSSTDVVPYQGMGVTGDEITLLYSRSDIWATASGSGAGFSKANPYPPVSLKLPGSGDWDDSLLEDGVNSNILFSDISLNYLPASRLHVNAMRMMAGDSSGLVSGPAAPFRGQLGFAKSYTWQGPSLNNGVPHVNFAPLLVRVSLGAASPFSEGELALAIAVYRLTNNEVRLHQKTGLDLFRLDPMVVE